MLFRQYIVRSMISVGYEGLAKHVRSCVRSAALIEAFNSKFIKEYL